MAELYKGTLECEMMWVLITKFLIMKRFTILNAIFFLAMGVNANTPAYKLIKRLRTLEKVGIMIGHQDDPVYGRNWKWDVGKSDVLSVTGDYPAVMGFDLGEIELGHIKNLDGVPFDRIRNEIIAQYKRNGIITLSWHPHNPVTGKSAWDPSGNAVKEIFPEGSMYSKFDGWLKIVAGFINSLKTEDGVKIPIIFRPWHEMSGGWFWWGKESCTSEEYKRLYMLTHDKLEKEYHCDNIVWAFSPNSGYNDFMKYYPGSSYVDILGVDLYEFDKDNAKYQKSLKHDLDEITQIGKKEKKIVALTETGCQQLPYANWFTNTLWTVLKNYKLSYVLFWRNAWDQDKEVYISYPGHSTENDFKEFYDIKQTLFVKDIDK